MKNYLLLIALFLTTTSVAISGNELNWETYTYSKLHASIMFPNAPKETITPDKDKTSTKYESEVNGVSFSFYVAEHKIQLEDHFALTKDGFDAFIEQINGRVIKEKTFTLNGYKGKEAIVYMKEYDKNIYYKTIIVGQFQYQLVALAKTKKEGKLAKKFLAGFATL